MDDSSYVWDNPAGSLQISSQEVATVKKLTADIKSQFFHGSKSHMVLSVPSDS